MSVICLIRARHVLKEAVRRGERQTPPTEAESEAGVSEAKASERSFRGRGEGRGFSERRVKSRLDKAEHQAVDCEAVAVIEATARSRRLRSRGGAH